MKTTLELHPDLEPLVEVAALAIADSVIPRLHGQLCPVWTRKSTIGECDCWILRRGRISAKAALLAVFKGSIVLEEFGNRQRHPNMEDGRAYDLWDTDDYRGDAKRITKVWEGVSDPKGWTNVPLRRLRITMQGEEM
jgi:hypothetical protein